MRNMNTSFANTEVPVLERSLVKANKYLGASVHVLNST